MAATPRFKVYSEDGQYQAACKELYAAIAIVATVGSEGWTVRDGHSARKFLWREGAEEIPASESFDRAVEIMWTRL